MKISLSSGAEGEALSFEGEDVVAIVPTPFAPGAPVELELAGLSLRGKTIRVKRRPDGRFDVTLRLLGLRRAERETLHLQLTARRERLD